MIYYMSTKFDLLSFLYLPDTGGGGGGGGGLFETKNTNKTQ